MTVSPFRVARRVVEKTGRRRRQPRRYLCNRTRVSTLSSGIADRLELADSESFIRPVPSATYRTPVGSFVVPRTYRG